MTSVPSPVGADPLTPEEFDELEAMLDDLRARHDDIPQWEFCEGFIAALVCCRRAIPAEEHLALLLGLGEADGPRFADVAQAERFQALWLRRMDEVARALDAEVDYLDDEAAYHPEVMDVRGAVAALPEAERAEMQAEHLPSFAQIWALGFMYAVEGWPEEWAPPRDRDAAAVIEEALQAVAALTEDDTGEPTVLPFGGDGPPSVSEGRLDDFAEAIWGVYDLREVWREIGPRVAQVRREDTPGRNDPCACGSGKKYKKCCGA